MAEKNFIEQRESKEVRINKIMRISSAVRALDFFFYAKAVADKKSSRVAARFFVGWLGFYVSPSTISFNASL